MSSKGRNPVQEPGLYERLRQYTASDFYPWHMPGHKRRLVEFDNPFSMDITEIDGFDDLHHPEGILKDAMEEASAVYGSEKTYFLVNGSSCGILAAISAAVPPGGKLLMTRNCHKSAYHAALLQKAQVTYIYPKLEKEGFYGAVQAEEVEAVLREDSGIRAVIVVSPGYEGVVSDIRAIAGVVHAHGCALLVDEAHGAHLPFGKNCGLDFPACALEMGADAVIQSLHKTLPSLTQTALLHLGKGSSARIDRERLELYLRIYQSSSPSYIFMASIDHCIRLMAGETGKQLMKEYAANLKSARGCLRERLHLLKLYEPELPGETVHSGGRYSFYDPSKFVIVSDGESVDGPRLADILRKKYHLEPEMSTDRYVILMSSPADTTEGFERMVHALTEIDSMLVKETVCRSGADMQSGGASGADMQSDSTPEAEAVSGCTPEAAAVSGCMSEAETIRAILPDRAPWAVMKSSEASACSGSSVPLSRAAGRVCRDFIYIYPPGVPLLVPGEQIEERHLELIRTWQKHGLEVHGIRRMDAGEPDAWGILCI
ncbi:MAG: aminotransferase class I/II-fold pyridoxal phosphate-dependent enzyme [Lachnospiraceae bacterium]